jgi:predicted 2-oxoglutarate/Fe(II)-dependent dioxygenase YbiX
MKWFDAASGLASLAALRRHVIAAWKPELDEQRRLLLLQELDDCIESLKSRAGKAERFHLAVMM